MNNIRNSVYHYYRAHFGELPPNKQFHFASRLYLWNRDEWAQKQLDQLKDYFIPNNDARTTLFDLKESSASSWTSGVTNAAELRAPYFKKYPDVYAYGLILFRILFLQTVYGIDARSIFYELFDKQTTEQTRDQLLHDTSALAVLSTYAINFIYLYDRLFHEDEKLVLAESWISAVVSGYDTADKTQLQLAIYFYTHCIIAETKFYARTIPLSSRSIYESMSQELERLIIKDFSNIHLDNKLEFLVCAQILGTSSNLSEQILDEAERSVNENGFFLIDKHNNFPQLHKSDFESSEHRNILYLLATSTFTPLNPYEQINP